MPSNNQKLQRKYESVRADIFMRKINEAKDEVAQSEFYTLLISQLEHCCSLMNFSVLECIVCYGLGKFCHCIIARYQLALLLLLKEKMNKNILLFDPAFEDIEIELIGKLQLTLFKNDNAFRKISRPTLVVLPHCSSQLTNNLLWTNWRNKLSNIVLLCNSFNKIWETTFSKELERMHYMYSIFPYIEELPINNCFSNSSVFNYLSFHVLPKYKVNEITEDIWKFNTKPKYSQAEIINLR